MKSWQRDGALNNILLEYFMKIFKAVFFSHFFFSRTINMFRIRHEFANQILQFWFLKNYAIFFEGFPADIQVLELFCPLSSSHCRLHAPSTWPRPHMNSTVLNAVQAQEARDGVVAGR